MKASLTGVLLSVCLVTPLAADPVAVTVDPSSVRSIGGITTLEREKYIVIHASPDDGDTDDEKFRYIEEELEAHFGRDGGVQSGQLQATPADPDNPGMPDVEHMRRAGAAFQAERAERPHRFRPEVLREVVLCTHPEWMMGLETNDYASFGPKTPEAAAEFAAQFLKHYYTDESRPQYYEVFNEPFVKAKPMGTNVRAMAEQHAVTARRIRELLPDDDIMIGGYSAAWAEVEARNFSHWNGWQKMFMDVAGHEMDFFSIHLYDGINVEGTHAERTGSNVVANMDLIDAYSFIKFGVAKPQAITEYGRIDRSPDNRVVPDRMRRMGGLLASFNGMLLMYMDHPDRLIKTVPYILGVAAWTYNFDGGMRSTEDIPSSFLLFRRAGDNYVTTELDKFYRLWKGVNGERRIMTATDPDVRCHYFADGLRHTAVMHNMDDVARVVQLSGVDDLDITKVTLRSLTTHGETPDLFERTLFGVPEQLTLEPGQTALLMMDLRHEYPAEQTILETRVYAENYLEAIEADQPIEFTYQNVPTGEGDAVLRLSIGRVPGLSLQPQVWVNETEVEVPTDWAGGTQEGRPTFFGMIPVKVPAEALAEETTVKLVFPDSGGKVAAAVLQTNLLAKED
ncbi:MAG: beta-agarase [Actinomycetota bacterium]